MGISNVNWASQLPCNGQSARPLSHPNAIVDQKFSASMEGMQCTADALGYNDVERRQSQYLANSDRQMVLPLTESADAHRSAPYSTQFSTPSSTQFPPKLCTPHHFAARPTEVSSNFRQTGASLREESQEVMSVGMTLRRPTNVASWGLFLSLFDGAFLVVGHARDTVNSMTTWARVTTSVPEPSAMFDPTISHEAFRAAVFKFPMEPNSPQRLLAGDVIVSVNGRAISSFDSLPMVTHYLRQCCYLSIVALRHKGALQQAHAVLQMENGGSSHPDRAYLAADAAYRAFRSALYAASSITRMPYNPALSSAGPHSRERTHRSMQNPHPTYQDSGGQWPAPRRSLFPPFQKNAPAPLQSYSGESASVLPGSKSPSTPSITKDFRTWLRFKKRTWKISRLSNKTSSSATMTPASSLTKSWYSKGSLNKIANAMLNAPTLGKKRPHCSINGPSPSFVSSPWRWTNPLFRDENGNEVVYSDSNYQFDPEDGTRAKNFLVHVDGESFPGWLAKRKKSWRKNWKVYELDDDDIDEDVETESYVAHDFWTAQGYLTFQHWLGESTTKWKRSYSWNQRKRRRIEKESEEIVHFPSSTGGSGEKADEQLRRWLRVRKNQWKILLRKRQRQREEAQGCNVSTPQGLKEDVHASGEVATEQVKGDVTQPQGSPRSIASLKLGAVPKSSEMFCIDALLEEEERRRKAFEERPPFDISFVFDARLGAPDDVIAQCLRFLHPSEHGKLLCISSGTSQAIKQRQHMWRQLCPIHWTLPRRPRKPWHELYITKYRAEEMASRKRSDDVLRKGEALLFKGDNLHQVQKLVNNGHKRFGFDVNYVSGVVCERNGLLNLAVINGRHKTVRWLVESKGADIESCDRGSFTPLINAAWEGDKYLVRLLLSNGADRKKIGTGHYTQPLAPPDFEGLNAEGWARKRGHSDVGDLIKLGLG